MYIYTDLYLSLSLTLSPVRRPAERTCPDRSPAGRRPARITHTRN